MTQAPFHFSRAIAILTAILLPVGMTAQPNQVPNRNRNGDLLEYANQLNWQWNKEKKRADSLAFELGFPVEYVEPGGRVVILQGLGPKNKPVYYATDNATAADVIATDLLWNGEGGETYLTGEGIEINFWDGGAILSTHQEFQSGTGTRIEMRNKELSISNHSTHIAGTAAARGVVADARGMAGKAMVYGWDFNNDLAEMAIAAADGMVLSNHSYGSLTGWYHNSSYNMWYWYGDPEVSESTDYEFGFYNQVSADLDFLAWSAPQYLVVKSAGNDRGEAPENQPVTHMVWNDNWVSSSLVRDPDGGTEGYDCLTPKSVAKNILTIGAVDDLGSMTSFSGFGPTDDGRIKPDMVANGTTIYSSTGTASTDYATYNGTSMAAASVTGSLALLFQLQQMLQPGVKLNSSTMKGLLIHTTAEAGQDPGPDYRYGWGLVDMKSAADLMEQNAKNGGLNIREQTIREGEVLQIVVKSLSSSPWLKVTICWTDPAANPSVPSLNSRDKKLVNDLDLLVENSTTHQQFLPWILDVENPDSPAARGINHVDNVEQVVIPNPGTGEFTIRVSHSGSLESGLQPFSLLISGISAPEEILPPVNLRFSAYETSVLLKWDAPGTTQAQSYRIYRDGNFIAESTEPSFLDLNLVTEREYRYYITAKYERDGILHESLPTNLVHAIPRLLRPLPFLVDFEIESREIAIKNSFDGWRWGDSESLNDYYLNFSGNETRFIGTSSYSAGETSHVMDIAATAPLRLADYSNVKLSFDYFLLTGIYDAIDEIHVVYKVPEEVEWREWLNLPVAKSWKPMLLDLPEGAYRNGTQIGFYYDDFYQWGMGAGLDNISVTGDQSLNSDLAITAMTEPVSSCSLSQSEKVSVTIKNNGGAQVLSGEMIRIHMVVSDGTSVTDQLILENPLASGAHLSHTMSSLINMAEPGSYEFNFRLEYANDNNLSNNILETWVESGGNPEVLILNTDLSFCAMGTPVQIQVSPTGGTLTGPGISGMYFNPAVAGVGTHTITYTYTDESGCQASDSEQVTVTALPVASILNTDLSFCVEGAPVQIQVSPTGGTLTGPGISGMYFNPAVAGVGTHTITYTYTDESGCQASDSEQVTVTALPVASILNTDLSFCVEGAPVQIQVSPSGGTLTGPGISGMYFNPAVAGVGTHTITYTYTDESGCQASDSEQVTVTALPMASILNTDLSFCVEGAPVQIQVSPSGGTLTGPGISGMYFNPAVAGVGTHTITYTYTDESGCQASDSEQVTVTALPVASILNTDLSFCVEGAPVQIQVSPTGGTLTGPGISGMYFNPAVAGVGTHTITYTYTDESGCQASDSEQVTVTALPVASILNTDLSFCAEGAPVQIQVSPSGGTLTGPGISGMYFNPAVAGVGTHTITYTYTDESGCQASDSEQVTVTALPVASILNTDLSFCVEGAPVQIQVSPSGGTLTGPGISGMYFNPAVAGVGTHTITYTYTDESGCQASDSEQVTVTALPVASILNTDLSFCAEGAPVQIQVSPSGGTLTGPGISGIYFNPAVAGVGTHTITYTYTDESGCQASDSKQVTVTALPVASILNTDLSFCVEGAPVEIKVAPEGGILSGPGVVGIYFCPEVAGVGSHTITYTVTLANGCMGTVSKQVEVGLPPEAEILNTNLSFCIEVAPVKIRVYPEGGILSGPGVVGMYFYPSVAGVGLHTLTYKFSESLGCQGIASKQVEVKAPALPSILNEDLVFCENHLPELIIASPGGGILSGPGCSGNYFFPEVAGPGIHTITYSYTDIQGCIGSCSRMAEVLPLPKPMFLTWKKDYCENDPAVEIKVNPEGGTLKGPGINSYHFSPIDAGTGFHTITYTYGDINGCFNSIQSQFRVKDIPTVDLGPDLNIGMSDILELWPITDAARFYWFDGSEKDHLILSGEELGAGIFNIWVKVMSLDSCFNADTILVTIDQANNMGSEKSPAEYHIYPNPVDDGFYLKIPKEERADQVSLYNQTGQIIMNHIPYTYPYFNVSHLLPGSYILKVQIRESAVFLKFIKL